MGTTSATSKKYHLPSILQNEVPLHELKIPFLEEEIDEVIKELPSDKAPDSFNGAFINCCWDIIAKDFMISLKISTMAD